MNPKKKIAVVMVNLGGPDCKEAIKPFLMNFFMDKNIIRLPVPFRCLLAWFIAHRRSKREASDSYGLLRNCSPLLENSRAQARKLEEALSTEKTADYKSFVCMRYWHPMAPQVVREVRDWGAEEIIILPLYPQFSTTTTRSSLGTWKKAMSEAGLKKPLSVVCCYPLNDGFIAASIETIKTQIKQAKKEGHENFRVLFSAHGLPQSIIKDGDPYQWQCEETAKIIAEKLALEDWAVCYQSRVGKQKWIGPSLEEELIRAAQDKKPVIIYPHSFTQEHVETLVELDIEYRHKAEEKGVPAYYRAGTVSTHDDFIQGLKTMVLNHTGTEKTLHETGKKLCPGHFRRCCMQDQTSV